MMFQTLSAMIEDTEQARELDGGSSLARRSLNPPEKPKLRCRNRTVEDTLVSEEKS